MKSPYFRFFAHFLVGIFLITMFSTTSARAQSSFELLFGAGYSFNDNTSGIDVGVDFEPHNYIILNPKTRIGWRYGVFFGPARGVYEGGLSSSYIQSEITKQMSGSSLSSYEMPDETDGGLLFGGKLLMSYFRLKRDRIHLYNIAIGPRISYFTKQEVSVTTVSTGGGYEYTEFSQIEYKDPVLVPGVEVQLSMGNAWIFIRYAYMFLPEDGDGMQMLGLSMRL